MPSRSVVWSADVVVMVRSWVGGLVLGVVAHVQAQHQGARAEVERVQEPDGPGRKAEDVHRLDDVADVGEHQGEVMGDETKVVAWCSSRRRALARARARQRHWCDAECVERIPGPVSTRSHRSGIAKMTPKCCQTLYGLKSTQ